MHKLLPLPCTLPRRRAGVLLHPSSLPGNDELGNGELGELGPEAFRFVEFLAAAGIGVWQVLPLGPTHADLSPYMSPSAHAGNPRLISLQLLREWGWLEDDALAVGEPQCRRHSLLEAARHGFMAHASVTDRHALQNFCKKHQFWLDDYALYQALRQVHYGRSWVDWPVALRDRQPQALREAMERLADAVAQAHFEQFVFFRQWAAIKQYANEHDIELLGDMPIFVAHDSAEVWAQRDYFELDTEGQPLTVAGVPPDYFSETGQRWGNPHYRWARMAEDGYQWWVARLQTALELFDRVRIDHFRGFEAYWEIPASAETAIDGHWVTGPGDDFFNALLSEFVQKPNDSEGGAEGALPLVAEDLGVITPAVEALRDRYGLPGMKILQFAFGGAADNPYLPHHHRRNAVVYTGTHDNNTTLGWFTELDVDAQRHVRRYLCGNDVDKGDIDMLWMLIRAAFASPAQLAIIPLQDLLELGSEARMNTPAQTEGNWRWRFQWSQVPTGLAARIKDLVQLYGRGTD